MAQPPRFLPALLIGLTLLGTFGLAAAIVRGHYSDSHDRPTYMEGPIGGPRNGAAFCVQAFGVSTTFEAQAKSQIDEILPELAMFETRFPGVGDLVPDGVVLGCPTRPAYYDPDLRYGEGRYLSHVRGLTVGEEGRYTMYFYIVPEREIARMSGPEGWRYAPQERACFGDYCAGATLALYLSPDEISNTWLITHWLYEMLGFECFRPSDLPVPSPTPQRNRDCP